MARRREEPLPVYGIRRRFKELETLGLAVELFPKYVNLEPRPHTVDVILLSFILKGKATHWMEGAAYEEDGVSLGITHFGQSHTIVTGPEGIEIINFYVNPERLALPELPAELARVLPDLLPLHSGFRNRLNRLVRLSFERPERVAELVRGTHDETSSGRPGASAAVMAFFKLLLIECCRSALSMGLRPSSEGESPSDRRLEELRRKIDRRFNESFTLDGLAEEAGLSRNYLCRAFKRYAGRSLFEYLNERRLQAAMLALRESGGKVASIAFECGFNDLSFFNRAFKKALGTTPSGYRRKFQGS